MTQEKHNPGMTASTADDWTIDYTYDLVGNRLAKTRTAGGLVRERVLDSYNHLDQLVSEIVETHTYNQSGVETIDSKSWLLEYDANGALTKKYRPTTGAELDAAYYGYDLQGRLLSSKTYARFNLYTPPAFPSADDLRFTEVRYAYNEQGVRVASMLSERTSGLALAASYTATTYLIDAHNPTGYASSIEDRTPTLTNVSPGQPLTGVSPASQPSVSYAYGLQIVAQRARDVYGNIAVSYFGLDHQGTTKQLVTDGPRATAIWYDAYGEFFDALGNSVSAPTETTHLFAMLVFDPASKLHYALARFLDTGSGRFVSQDPWEGNFQNPLTLPRYWYAGADPVNMVDPNGMRARNGGLPGILDMLPAEGEARLRLAQVILLIFTRDFVMPGGMDYCSRWTEGARDAIVGLGKQYYDNAEYRIEYVDWAFPPNGGWVEHNGLRIVFSSGNVAYLDDGTLGGVYDHISYPEHIPSAWRQVGTQPLVPGRGYPPYVDWKSLSLVIDAWLSQVQYWLSPVLDDGEWLWTTSP